MWRMVMVMMVLKLVCEQNFPIFSPSLTFRAIHYVTLCSAKTRPTYNLPSLVSTKPQIFRRWGFHRHNLGSYTSIIGPLDAGMCWVFREAAASQKTFSSPGSDLIPHPVLPSQASENWKWLGLEMFITTGQSNYNFPGNICIMAMVC